MNVNFSVSSFSKNPSALISLLGILRKEGEWSVRHEAEIESIVCKNPSMAYKFCRFVNYSYGVSRSAEAIFLKNPSIGVRYLRLVNRREFLDAEVQRRFWGKVSRNPSVAYEWASIFRERLPVDMEEVFLKDVRVAKSYSFFIIKGAFSESVHSKLLLKSFESMDELSKRCLSDYIRYAGKS